MEPAVIAVSTYAGLTIGSITLAGAILSKGSQEETGTHTVEIYHGNHWSTWLTPGQNRLYTAAMGTAGAVGFLGAIAVIIGTAVWPG